MEIELADVVASVRDELVAAAARGAGSDVEFVVGPIELEFAVEMRRDAKVKAGFPGAKATRTCRSRVRPPGRLSKVAVMRRLAMCWIGARHSMRQR
ncbi:trypco2 family protein [Amycolatopsis sp. NPDC049688]|uniref:trypco2 family protein n=1 Tax=Amycolatopsis sp. NPDC049688 TaxID=3154733 RepID=UPI003418FD17